MYDDPAYGLHQFGLLFQEVKDHGLMTWRCFEVIEFGFQCPQAREGNHVRFTYVRVLVNPFAAVETQVHGPSEVLLAKVTDPLLCPSQKHFNLCWGEKS